MKVLGSQAWVPNLLTLSRFPLSAAFYLLTIRERFAEALGVLVLAQTTDWIDGALARRWHAQTKFGAVFEHIADTFMLAIAGLGLAQLGILPLWIYVASIVYCVLTWITPQRIKRLWALNVVLGMRTLLYGTALAVVPFIILWMVAARNPALALAILGGFILYGLGTLYWKRGRIHHYWRRFYVRAFRRKSPVS